MTPPVLTAREKAARLLALRVLTDRIKVEENTLRAELVAELMVGERQAGALDPADPATLLGFVQLTKARESWVVTDPAAFLAWCERVAAEEVVTTRAVRASFTAAVLADCKSHGAWISPDGELLAPDGVDVRIGSPVLTVKATAEADALVAEAFASHRMAIGGTS